MQIVVNWGSKADYRLKRKGDYGLKQREEPRLASKSVSVWLITATTNYLYLTFPRQDHVYQTQPSKQLLKHFHQTKWELYFSYLHPYGIFLGQCKKVRFYVWHLELRWRQASTQSWCRPSPFCSWLAKSLTTCCISLYNKAFFVIRSFSQYLQHMSWWRHCWCINTFRQTVAIPRFLH